MANFTFHVTMPYLNFVQLTGQDGLCEMLPKLYHDLTVKKLDTLLDYKVPWTHVNMAGNSPSSELDHYVLGEMCLTAAQGVKVQCEQEYCSDTENIRATQVHMLSKDEK